MMLFVSHFISSSVDNLDDLVNISAKGKLEMSLMITMKKIAKGSLYVLSCFMQQISLGLVLNISQMRDLV